MTTEIRTMRDVIARQVRLHREGLQLSQKELSIRMTARGFNWSRTSVVEAEGGGRGRAVSLAELFGLADVLDISVMTLLIEPLKDGPIEVTPKGQVMKKGPDRVISEGLVIEDVADLVNRTVSREVVRDLADEVGLRDIRSRASKLNESVEQSLRLIAEGLRESADWYEHQAAQQFIPMEED